MPSKAKPVKSSDRNLPLMPDWHRSKENPLLSKTQAACVEFLVQHNSLVFTEDELQEFIRTRIAVCDPMGCLSRLRKRGLIDYRYLGKRGFELYSIEPEAMAHCKEVGK